ncbi:MAG: universal stress protein [Magnetococcus sp. YQC-3]
MVEQTVPSQTWEGTSSLSLLLAHHGTTGARHAEALAFELAHRWSATIHHLLVVPAFWRDMMGDDWLNNASTRQQFGHYLEDLLSREAQAHLRAVEEQCLARNLPYTAQIRLGDPTDCLLEYARSLQPAMVVIGPQRPKGVPGFRCRMQINTLLRGLTVPLMIAPWPP